MACLSAKKEKKKSFKLWKHAYINQLSMLCFMGCKILFVSHGRIDLSGCINLIDFPQIRGNITKLDLSETPIEEVPSSIECLADLKTLRLSNCMRLKRLSIKHL